eukprot:4606784-Amphidinium_carterae.1
MKMLLKDVTMLGIQYGERNLDAITESCPYFGALHCTTKQLAVGLAFNASLDIGSTEDQVEHELVRYPSRLRTDPEFRSDCVKACDDFESHLHFL